MTGTTLVVDGGISLGQIRGWDSGSGEAGAQG